MIRPVKIQNAGEELFNFHAFKTAFDIMFYLLSFFSLWVEIFEAFFFFFLRKLFDTLSLWIFLSRCFIFSMGERMYRRFKWNCRVIIEALK